MLHAMRARRIRYDGGNVRHVQRCLGLGTCLLALGLFRWSVGRSFAQELAGTPYFQPALRHLCAECLARPDSGTS
jgi:hypothetical protein